MYIYCKHRGSEWFYRFVWVPHGLDEFEGVGSSGTDSVCSAVFEHSHGCTLICGTANLIHPEIGKGCSALNMRL